MKTGRLAAALIVVRLSFMITCTRDYANRVTLTGKTATGVATHTLPFMSDVLDRITVIRSFVKLLAAIRVFVTLENISFHRMTLKCLCRVENLSR